MLLLHGLAGHAGEWTETAAALAGGYRVVAVDQRGHGRSEREPAALTRAAFVAGVVTVIEALRLAPVALVGQSMGANTAFLTAAAHPAMVASLVVIEASPDGPAPDLPGRISDWLATWPVPFPDRDHAIAFFASQGLAPSPWADGLEARAGGLWPRFEPRVVIDCIADLAARDYRSEWSSIRCPTLLVHGENGNYTAKHIHHLASAITNCRTVAIRGAGHDAHLDAPAQWTHELAAFLTATRHHPAGSA